MIKILHSADWHLCSPLQLSDEGAARQLRQLLLTLPGKIAALCGEQQCDLVLLSGDLFDGAPTAEAVQVLKSALAEMAVPVFIAPGNHDFADSRSVWLTEQFPENVHIFTRQAIEFKDIPTLDCRIYGAGFVGMDCPGLLDGFRADSPAKYNIGIFHGDPTQVSSPYFPITREQVKGSGLQYLALGHIHKGDSFMAGKTLCAWPGCPMGRGYDEAGEKGVLITSIDHTAATAFIPLDVPRFYDLTLRPEELSSALPPAGNRNFYRITLTGPSVPIDLSALAKEYDRFPNLILRDRTVPIVDVWSTAGEDTFEGTYFSLLRNALADSDPDTQRQVLLAAQISRQLLDGQEVVLP